MTTIQPDNFNTLIETSEALEHTKRIAAYQQCALDFAKDIAGQQDVEDWLNFPMDE